MKLKLGHEDKLVLDNAVCVKKNQPNMWTEVTIQEFSNLCTNKQTNGDCELDLEYSLLINK